MPRPVERYTVFLSIRRGGSVSYWLNAADLADAAMSSAYMRPFRSRDFFWPSTFFDSHPGKGDHVVRRQASAMPRRRPPPRHSGHHRAAAGGPADRQGYLVRSRVYAPSMPDLAGVREQASDYGEMQPSETDSRSLSPTSSPAGSSAASVAILSALQPASVIPSIAKRI
jgi:hypothetical protein